MNILKIFSKSTGKAQALNTNIFKMPLYQFSQIINGFDETSFVKKASFCINEWALKLEEFEGTLVDEVELSDGVLKVKVNDFNIFVINRQIPNRQIWYSSPLSGPQRFDYCKEKEQWENMAHGELFSILVEEVKKINDS